MWNTLPNTGWDLNIIHASSKTHSQFGNFLNLEISSRLTEESFPKNLRDLKHMKEEHKEAFSDTLFLTKTFSLENFEYHKKITSKYDPLFYVPKF